MESIIRTIALAMLIGGVNGGCKTTEKNVPAMNQQALPTEEKKYHLVVSFFSVAYGIDHKAKTALDNLITEDTLQNKKRIIVEKTPWGREGELDYCIDLQYLEKKSQTEFINKAKALLSSSNLVHIKENEPCRKPVR